MKKYFLAIFIPILGFALIFSCSQNKKIENQISVSKDDSIKLKELIISMLKWYSKDGNYDFDVVSDKNRNFDAAKDSIYGIYDSIFVGINWQSYKKRMTELAETKLFTKNFLNNYQNIALLLDKELKENQEKWHVGDMPPYGDGANEWCDCQDFPSENWQKILKIFDLKLKDSTVKFKWTWEKDFSYSVEAIKENNVWKINELEKFNIENFSW